MNDMETLCLTTRIGPWRVRVDKPRGQGQEHVHVSRNGLNGEYSWNKDGTRHDKGRFPASEKMIGRAKEIAASTLNVPEGSLQLITAIPGTARIHLSSFAGLARARSLLTCYVRAGQSLVLLGSPKGLVAVVADEG